MTSCNISRPCNSRNRSKCLQKVCNITRYFIPLTSYRHLSTSLPKLLHCVAQCAADHHALTPIVVSWRHTSWVERQHHPPLLRGWDKAPHCQLEFRHPHNWAVKRALSELKFYIFIILFTLRPTTALCSKFICSKLHHSYSCMLELKGGLDSSPFSWTTNSRLLALFLVHATKHWTATFKQSSLSSCFKISISS